MPIIYRQIPSNIDDWESDDFDSFIPDEETNIED